jgi:VanZ family protein
MALVQTKTLVYPRFWVLLIGFIALLIVYASWMPIKSSLAINTNDKFLHFITYFIFTVYILSVCRQRFVISSMILITIFSLCVEFGQSYLPYRSFEAFDILANIIGISFGFLMSFRFSNDWLVLIEKRLIRILF